MRSLDTWLIVALPAFGLLGWFGGYCYGFLMGEKAAERWIHVYATPPHEQKPVTNAPSASRETQDTP